MAYKIAVVVGSLRKDSYNRKVARTVCASRGDDLECRMVEIGDLPLYNQDYDPLPQQPEQFVRFRDAIRAADGILFCTPEYNRGIPGVLKNAIDVGSRPYGQNVWDQKPAAIISASIGAIGGFGATHQLRQSCVFVNMPVMAQPEAYLSNISDDDFDEDGLLKDGSTRRFVETIAHAFHDWVDMIHRSRAALAEDPPRASQQAGEEREHA
ncbi:MAG TPA: NAD(P)H-dependent oxidoreductase [Sphingomicrobium sp.]|jgi:chromate reductase|nr:NAD(P)H-dependent oxidoreductase [Sphingomicrobium sp.]